MAGYRRGSGGKIHPITGRKLRIFTVVCRKCRRFAPAIGIYQTEANENAEKAGWKFIEGENGICPECQEKENKSCV